MYNVYLFGRSDRLPIGTTKRFNLDMGVKFEWIRIRPDKKIKGIRIRPSIIFIFIRPDKKESINFFSLNLNKTNKYLLICQKISNIERGVSG